MTFSSEVDSNTRAVEYHTGDCLDVLKCMPDKSVDLIFGSSPYEAARTYGLDFNLRGQAFIDWCFPRYMECRRVCRGVVAWVLEGQTRQYRYSATPILLMADLHRAGVHLRKPPAYERDGVPGSGGPDWLKNRYEFIVCSGPGGRLPFSDPTACGRPPKYDTGGACSNRHADGKRHNHSKRGALLARTKSSRGYAKPAIANPGNIIRCGPGGGGHMGHPIAHENEAPFPLKLAEFFVKSFCPPGGTVLDPFGGSGTVAHAALLHGRNAILIDIRQSEIDRAKRRIDDVLSKLQPATTEQPA